jgi:dihydrofolate reductase
LRGAAAILLGRCTYEGFAAVWPTVKSDMADRMNALPKHVALRTIAKPEWANTSILGENLVASVRDLKTKVDGNILIDEFALMVYPVVLGRVIRLFPDGVRVMETIEDRSLGDGIALLRYQTRGSAEG